MEKAVLRETRMHENTSARHLPPCHSDLCTINDEWETLSPEQSLCSPNAIDFEYQHLKQSEIHDRNDRQVQKPHISRKSQDKDDIYHEKGTDVRFKNEQTFETRDKVCTICHVNIHNTSFNRTPETEYEFTCSQGHSLCYGCIQQFGIRTDMGCIFCGLNQHYATDQFAEEQNRQSIRRVQKEQQQQSSLDSHDLYSNCNRCKNAEISQNNTCFNFQRHGSLEKSQNESENAHLPNDLYNRQYQPPNSYNMTKNILKQTMSAEKINLTNQFFSEYSRRPIRCPRVDCAMNVAFSALTHHFLFDHPEVPIVCVDPGAKSTLIVALDALTCDISRCLALLLVSGKLTDPAAWMFNGNHINEKYCNRLPLPVLAARICYNGCNVSPCDVHASGEGQCKKDIVIIWVAGLDIGSTGNALRCSIQAIDNIENNGFRSLTYTGPINSLRTTQHPGEVFLNGDCIVLHEGFIDRVTSGCASLNIDIIVH